MYPIFKKFLGKPHPAVVAVIAIASIALLGVKMQGREAQDIADESIFRGVVLEVVSEQEKPHPVRGTLREQTLRVEIDFNDTKEEQVITNDFIAVEKGTRILVQAPQHSQGDNKAYLLDAQRTNGLITLAIAFVVLVLLVGGFKGLYALVGLAFSFVVIFFYVMPQILRNADPVITGLAGALAILLVTLYCSYGINRKSVAAFVGIFISLVIVGILANVTVSALHFTGMSTEESVYLQSETSGMLSIIGILIAGIIIAAIGVLDDVAITQASTVEILASVDPNLRGRRLFWKAMDVGRDHISAVINTLILAYTGAALPLLLLLAVNEFPLSFTLNGEIIAEEIIRTLISSIGLVLAVPLSTACAVFLEKKYVDHPAN